MHPASVSRPKTADLRKAPFTPGEHLLLSAFLNEVIQILGPAGVERIIVFGSRARGQGHADSDLDVGVFVPGRVPRATHHRVAEIAAAVQEGHADLPHLRPIVIGSGDHTNSALLRAMERDGIDLWAKKNG
jgi:predicted nucleotidyltransferase